MFVCYDKIMMSHGLWKFQDIMDMPEVRYYMKVVSQANVRLSGNNRNSDTNRLV